MSTGAGARDIESPLPSGMTFPRKRSVTRRFPEVELVEGEFQFITESRKPSTTSILVPPIQLTEKDGILRDDYWNQIRTEWRVSEDNEDMSLKERSTLAAPTQPIPRASLELPAPCTAYLQSRFRDGPFEVLYPGSTEHYERREEARAHTETFSSPGFHQRNLSDSTTLPRHGATNGLSRVIEEPERPRWYTTVEPKTLARSLFYFGFCELLHCAYMLAVVLTFCPFR